MQCNTRVLKIFVKIFTSKFDWIDVQNQQFTQNNERFFSEVRVSFHDAPIFGLTCGALGFDNTSSQRAFMFITIRDMVSDATRLNLIGTLGAALLQHQVAPIAEVILDKWMNRDVEEACQTMPLLDTVQGCHGYLFSSQKTTYNVFHVLLF